MNDEEFFTLAGETTALINVVSEVFRQVAAVSPDLHRAIDAGLENALRIAEGAAVATGKGVPPELSLHAVEIVQEIIKAVPRPRD